MMFLVPFKEEEGGQEKKKTKLNKQKKNILTNKVPSKAKYSPPFSRSLPNHQKVKFHYYQDPCPGV